MTRRGEALWIYAGAVGLAGCLIEAEPVARKQGLVDACGAPSESIESSEPFTDKGGVEFSDEELKSIAAAAGFAGEPIEVEGTAVRVGEDVVLDAHLLVQGAYGHGAPEGVRKGYRYPGLVECEREKDIRLRFAEGAHSPPKAIRKAFLAAAADWSADGSVSIDVANTGDTITVHVVSSELWSIDTPCGAEVTACALTPADGRPGADVYVREHLQDVTPPCEWAQGSQGLLRYVARHELGHALGIHHPGDGGKFSQHIEGTEACASDDESCERDPGYDTVMITGVQPAADCTLDFAVSLGADDRESLHALYGS